MRQPIASITSSSTTQISASCDIDSDDLSLKCVAYEEVRIKS